MKPYITSVIAVTVVVTVVFFAFLFENKNHPNFDIFKPVEERDYWVEEIKTKGPTNAYQAFLSLNAKRPFGIQHDAAHVIGEALYIALGAKGVAVCDQAFSFGCYHGLFSFAISEHGTELVPLLDGECQKLKSDQGACQHGIGHGILQYFGYDRLNEALKACGLAERIDEISGCPSGVFMEYNVPLVEGQDGFSEVVPRSFQEGNPYEPCGTVPNEFRASCYYELPQWWQRSFQDDYAVIGRLCAEIPDDEYIRGCFVKTGDLIAHNGQENLDIVKELCSKMPTSYGEGACLFSAAQTLWTFVWAPETKEVAADLCVYVRKYFSEERCNF